MTCRIDLHGAWLIIMRTPGRCSNIEGCWISASRRDVWLNVGEDFTCPNCGGALSAPPGRALSMRGLKRTVATGLAAGMAVAAVAVLAWSGQPAMLAMIHARNVLLTSTPRHQAAPAQLAMAAPVPPPAAMPAPGIAPAPTFQPALPDRAAAPVLLYTASPSPVAPPHRTAPDAAQPQTAANTPDRDVPPAMVTLLSEAAFVLKPSEDRPLIVPVSFGKPMAPETDAAPVDRRWHHRGLANIRHSYFLPAPPTDAVSAICRSPSMLR